MYAQDNNIAGNQQFNPYQGAQYTYANPTHQYAGNDALISFKEVKDRIESEQDEGFRLMRRWERIKAKMAMICFTTPVLISIYLGFQNISLALVALIVLGLIAFFLYKELRTYVGKEIEVCTSNIKENIYVYSEHPGDETVYIRQLALEKMIMASKNKWYPMVVAIYFRDGQNANELWAGTWPARLLQTFLQDRDKRHRHLSKDYPEDYRKYILKQKQ